MVTEWGTVTPTGTLLFGLIIVIAGILLGSRYSLYAALVSVAILVLFEYLKVQGLVVPNISWMHRPSSFSDIIGFAIIFAVIALVLWLYNQQMERSLQRAHASEAALNKQNESLERMVETRTRQLQLAQMEKLQQVYRFAELGRISSALFHDLANHLTAVSLDIEGLSQSKKSKIVKQIKGDITYIDDIVQRVRLQLRGQGEISRFDARTEITTVSNALRDKMTKEHISFTCKLPAKPLYCRADIVPFRQIISNLLQNAIESYAKSRRSKRPITLTATSDDGHIIISVQDSGIGIEATQQEHIFEPFYSSKADGTGIGLFIVKQIVEHDLGGTIQLVSQPKKGTTFIVTLPHAT